MFITYPLNIDYLMDEVRLHIGDTDETQFSDSIIRSALISAVKFLQRKWSNRYLVYYTTMLVSPLPSDFIYQSDYDALIAASGTTTATVIPTGYLYASLPQGYGYVPSGLAENDIFRNPYHTFTEPGATVISQEDEFVIILAASIILARSRLSSSATSFVNWSDGEYSYSNVASSNTMRDLLSADLSALDAYFKRGLARPIRANLPEISI